MKAVGIIAEYNPFHNGHKYHLLKSLEISKCESAVAVMSGNFTQRGEPAILEKWTRAEIAIKNGVSLVAELPFIYACNSAEYFAKGGVQILNAMENVSHIAFGSEEGALSQLKCIAKILVNESADFKSTIKDYLNTGISFPKARQMALEEVVGRETAELIRYSNNILAVEYLKQLIITDSKIVPIAIGRKGDNYLENDVKSPFASAMAIRKIMTNNREDDTNIEMLEELLPKETAINLNLSHQKSVTLEDFRDMIMYKLFTTGESQLKEIFSVGEGLENKLTKVLRENREFTITDYIKNVVSKRYTETRISRIIVHILMNINKDLFNKIEEFHQSYIKVLGADQKGVELLSFLKKNKSCDFPIISNLAKSYNGLNEGQKLMMDLDILASDVYNIASGFSTYKGSDFTKKAFIQK